VKLNARLAIVTLQACRHFCSGCRRAMITLSDPVIKSMRVGRTYSEGGKPINSLDFSDDGQFLVAADDEALRVYDTNAGVFNGCLIKSTKYGVDLIRYTHSTDAIIYVWPIQPLRPCSNANVVVLNRHQKITATMTPSATFRSIANNICVISRATAHRLCRLPCAPSAMSSSVARSMGPSGCGICVHPSA